MLRRKKISLLSLWISQMAIILRRAIYAKRFFNRLRCSHIKRRFFIWMYWNLFSYMMILELILYWLHWITFFFLRITFFNEFVDLIWIIRLGKVFFLKIVKTVSIILINLSLLTQIMLKFFYFHRLLLFLSSNIEFLTFFSPRLPRFC